jgi:hypothetical protein
MGKAASADRTQRSAEGYRIGLRGSRSTDDPAGQHTERTL